MKIFYLEKKEGAASIMPETLEDLWHLEKIIKKGDMIEGKTYRTFKIGNKEEKKPVYLKIEVEKVRFSKTANRLRVLGVIKEGSPEEYVQLGKHHSMEIEIGTKIKIIKDWKNYEIERLKEAEKEGKKPRAIIVLIDDEKANISEVRAYGIEYGPTIYKKSSKKWGEVEETIYKEILETIRNKTNTIIIAGPGFEKERLKKIAEKEGFTVILENASTTEKSGIIELLKNKTIEKTLGEIRAEKELVEVEKALEEIYKEGNVAYGLEDVEKATEYGAVEKVLVLDEEIRENEKIEEIINKVEKQGGKISIISSEGEAGEKLKGFGKIIAFLRFKIE